jgi:hypothetical protein
MGSGYQKYLPGVNTRESADRDGIFASHIGADSASIVSKSPGHFTSPAIILRSLTPEINPEGFLS